MFDLKRSFLLSVALHAGGAMLVCSLYSSVQMVEKKGTGQPLFVDLVRSKLRSTLSVPALKRKEAIPEKRVKIKALKTVRPAETIVETADIEKLPVIPEKDGSLMEQSPVESRNVEDYEESDMADKAIGEGPETVAAESTGYEESRDNIERVEAPVESTPDLLPLILERIERAKIYPRSARKRGIEGTATVKFRINPKGNVEEINVVEPSGHSILDKAAVKTIKRAAPFPAVDSVLKIAVTFRLT